MSIPTRHGSSVTLAYAQVHHLHPSADRIDSNRITSFQSFTTPSNARHVAFEKRRYTLSFTLAYGSANIPSWTRMRYVHFVAKVLTTQLPTDQKYGQRKTPDGMNGNVTSPNLFIRKFRDLVKWRLSNGDSQDRIRRLLREFPLEDIPSLLSSPTPSPLPHPVMQQTKPPIQHFSDNLSNESPHVNQSQISENSFPPLPTSTYDPNYSILSNFAGVPFTQAALGDSAGSPNPALPPNQTTQLLMSMDTANYLTPTESSQFLSEPSGQLSYDPVSTEDMDLALPTPLMNPTQFVEDSSTSAYSTDPLYSFRVSGPDPFFPSISWISQPCSESEGPGSNATAVSQHSLANASLSFYTRNEFPT